MEATGSAPIEVVDSDGAAACAGAVVVVDSRGRHGRAGMVGPHRGRYLVLGLAPGQYAVMVAGPAGYARVIVRVPGTDPVLVRLARAEVSGRLMGVSDPVGWRARWQPEDPTSLPQSASVDADGTFRLSVEAGVTGRVLAVGEGSGGGGWAEAAGVSSESGELVLHRTPGHTLSGRVVGFPGLHLWRATLRVRWYGEPCVREAHVNPDGTFRLDGLPEGTATLELGGYTKRFVHWPAVASGRTDVVLRCPSVDDAPDAEGLAAETQPFVDAFQAPLAER
jgi:hypothetical protein